MLIDLSNLLQRGVIDNSVRGLVDLRLWCGDKQEPLHFILMGNCSQDIAGCRVSFCSRVYPSRADANWKIMESIAEQCQELRAGDITLSRRVVDQDNRRALSNTLSIEFFAEEKARILMEVDHFDFDISLPQWEMNWEDANLQSLMSMEAMRGHVLYCSKRYRGHAWVEDSEAFPRCSWDDVLNVAESKAAICRSVSVKYAGERQALSSIAYVLDLPDALNNLANIDEAALPPELSLTPELGLFDYLDSQHRDAVQKAMQHTLFHCTTQLTDHVCAKLGEAVDQKLSTVAETDPVMACYSGIVSNILSSILLVQEAPAAELSTEQILQRLRNVRQRLKDVTQSIPKSITDTTDLLEAARELINQLDEFCSELIRH